jgi:choline dehydrogenase-like flavoprotein
MLSGIGDKNTLGEFGIETIVDSPDVGQNLQVGLESSVVLIPLIGYCRINL